MPLVGDDKALAFSEVDMANLEPCIFAIDLDEFEGGEDIEFGDSLARSEIIGDHARDHGEVIVFGENHLATQGHSAGIDEERPG